MPATSQQPTNGGALAVDGVEARAARLARVARALAAETRLCILMLLNEQPLCVCALAERLGLSQPAASQHLRILKEAGLIRRVKRANYVHYRPVAGVLEDWRALLGSCCCREDNESSCCIQGIERTNHTCREEF